jgi:hypothetical protein
MNSEQILAILEALPGHTIRAWKFNPTAPILHKLSLTGNEICMKRGAGQISLWGRDEWLLIHAMNVWVRVEIGDEVIDVEGEDD